MTRVRRSLQARAHTLIAFLMLVSWIHGLTPVAIAQTPMAANCVVASEPNDEPFQAVEIGSGPGCATGDPTVAGTDFYHWIVLESGQPVAWNLAITAIPAAVGVIGLFTVAFDDQGRQVAYTELLNLMGVEGEPHAINDVLLAPGDYYIAVAYNKPGPYQLTVSETNPLPDAIAPGDETSQVSGAFGVSGAIGDSEIKLAWTIDKDAAATHFDMVVRGGVEATLSWYLTNPEGVIVYSSQIDPRGNSAMPDLGLDPGTYLITLTRSTPTPWVVTATATTPRSPALEDEPNETTADAQPLAIEGDSFTLTGRIAEQPTGNGTDTFAFTVDAARANRLTDVRLISLGAVNRRLCLYDGNNVLLGCAESAAGAALNDLVLPAGGYILTVYGPPDPSTQYVLKIDVSGEPAPGFETEPNLDPAHANPLAPDGVRFVSAGRFEGANGDIDHFRITTDDPPQLWLIEVTGDGVTELGQLDAGGQVLAYAAAESGVATLSDVYLASGDHVFSVRGNAGEYAITATPLGPAGPPATPVASPGATPVPAGELPDPHHEQEPNDSPGLSQPIVLLEERTGRLATDSDLDFYRFSLQGSTAVLLTIDVPDNSMIDGLMDWNGRRVLDFHSPNPGDPIVWSGLLQAGDYSLQLSSSIPAPDPYRLSLVPLDPFAVPDDLEPNDSIPMAAPMPASLQVSGTLNPVVSPQDADWYVLPAIDTAQVLVTASGEGVEARLWSAPSAEFSALALSYADGDAPGTRLFDLPAGETFLLEVSGAGDYTVIVRPPGEPLVLAATPVPVVTQTLSASLDFGTAEPAAYWHEAQVVEGVFRITNGGDRDVAVDLIGLAGHVDWRVTPAPGALTIAAGYTEEIPVSVLIPPDAWAGHPIAIAMQAVGGNDQASAMAVLTPSGTAVPINPEPWTPLPPALLGGLDVAWTALGAHPVTDEAPSPGELELYNQLYQNGYGWPGDTDELPLELVVDLMGDDPVPVAGIILFPPGYGLSVDNQVKDFELDVSTDGVTWTTVLRSSLPPLVTEQAFVLDAPVNARYARLRVLSSQLFGVGTVVLGELKIVAAPDWSAGPFDIASFDRGGHVVDIQPPLRDFPQTQLMLMPDRQQISNQVEPGTPVTWTVGFNHDRAALITSIEWVSIPDNASNTQFASVQVEVSTDTPLGPWTSLGEFPIDADGKTTTIALESPTWARFVRFTAIAPDAEDNASTVWLELPERLRIYEAAVDSEYRSILGEWGTFARDAIFEQQFTPASVALDPDAGNDAASATLLGPQSPYVNTAALDVDEDWYRIAIPPGDSVLNLDLEGIPALGVGATLFDEGGTEIPLTSRQTDAATIRLTADVEPGGTYVVRIVQPITSVIFAFDTSGSIRGFESSVSQGLSVFATGVLAGHEFVNLLPFGESLRLDEWSDKSWVIQAAVRAYARSTDNSEAEEALVASMNELEKQDGNLAIVIITDAESSHPQATLDALWAQFGNVMPRIFTIQIAGAATHAIEQDLMQDWAMVNGGQYVYVRDQGSMDIAFDRAATMLRRPATYAVTASTETAPPTTTPVPSPTAVPTPTQAPTATPAPEATTDSAPTSPLTPESAVTPGSPGTLQVVAPDSAEALPASREGQVAIILDTSGSMLQQLDDRSRADIAKSSLIDLVSTTIPAGTIVSFRTFGNTPDSCESMLAVPPGPLDPLAMVATISGLPIINLVRTPIGASLEAVALDLAESSGPKVVVLVTDGEETCDGDPAAAIAALVASGIDVRVNIVGFAIDDATARETLAEWARLGNGQYIDAGNVDELNAAVAQAVQPTFEVRDEAGMVVATGLVGSEAVSLPAGIYTVAIQSDPEVVIAQVVVESGQQTTVEARAP